MCQLLPIVGLWLRCGQLSAWDNSEGLANAPADADIIQQQCNTALLAYKLS